MRRALAAVLLGGALLVTAACGSTTDTGAAPSPSAAGPDYSANTKQVCGALEEVLSGKTLETETTKAVTDAVKGKTTEAQIDKATVEAMKKVFTKWADGIAAEAAKAEDPQVKQDIQAFATALKAEVKKMRTIDDADTVMDGAQIEAAGAKIDKHCA
jgi:hypothetical protein